MKLKSLFTSFLLSGIFIWLFSATSYLFFTMENVKIEDKNNIVTTINNLWYNVDKVNSINWECKELQTSSKIIISYEWKCIQMDLSRVQYLKYLEKYIPFLILTSIIFYLLMLNWMKINKGQIVLDGNEDEIYSNIMERKNDLQSIGFVNIWLFNNKLQEFIKWLRYYYFKTWNIGIVNDNLIRIMWYVNWHWLFHLWKDIKRNMGQMNWEFFKQNKMYSDYYISKFKEYTTLYNTSFIQLFLFVIWFIFLHSIITMAIVPELSNSFLYYLYNTTSIASNLGWEITFTSEIGMIYWIYLQISGLMLFWLMISTLNEK